MIEGMKKKRWKRKLAAWLIVSLCAGICPAPAASRAAETVAQTETADVEQGAQTEEDPAWEDEEVVVEVDENGKDEWGNTYKIEEVAANKYEMTLAGAGNKLPQNKNGEFMLRVADKVIMRGEEYKVTTVEFTTKREENIQLYIGKNVSDINCFKTRAYGFVVHSENSVYTSEEGCLYSKDKKTLYYFSDQNYGKDEVYQLPESVEELSNRCFFRARIKEVMLNEKIQRLRDCAFRESTIRKIDLKNVTTIEDSCFTDCKYLEEIKMNKEGITIGHNAFDRLSSLKNLFFPPHTKLEEEVINCMNDETLETMVFGGEAEFKDTTSFVHQNKIGLKTLILPKDLKEIGGSIAAYGVLKLRKLYIPDTVEKIENEALNSKGNLSLYGKSNSVAAQYDDDNVSFHSLEGHEHKLEDVTFFSFDTWGVKGKYCKECAYAEDIKKVDYITKEDQNGMPELLVQPEDKCPECLELDEKNTDDQGVIYELDDELNMALVKSINSQAMFPKEIFLIPENVQKEGKRYEVKMLLSGSMNRAKAVILPDTIISIESGSFSNGLCQVQLGKNVREIGNGAFCSANVTISIRGNNSYYKIVDNVLFDAEMKTLLCYMKNNKRSEYMVPASVRFIGAYAFASNNYLENIYIPNEKNVLMDEQAFTEISGEVIDLQQTNEEVAEEDDYTWNGEDKVAELDEEYKDNEGYYYQLNTVKSTASMVEIDMSEFSGKTKEIDIRVPDKVMYNNHEYKVTEIKMHMKESRVMHCNSGKNYRNQMVNWYIGKNVSTIVTPGLYGFELKITSYVHVLNKSFVSDKGSLFDKDKKILYRFSDREYEGKDYTLPQSVRIIQDYAFYQADIRSVTFNHWISTVPDYAFECSNVKKVDLGHVKNIDGNAFAYCYYLNEVNFHEQGITIDSMAFYMTKNLKKMYIPEDSSIGFYAFGYSGLETLIMGENTTLAKEGAFSECYDLQVINLQEGVETLKGSALRNCFNLQKLYIPKTLQSFSSGCLTDTSLELYTWNQIEDGTFSERDTDCTVVLLEDHAHSFKKMTFMAFDTWMVTGKYCKECSAVEDVKKVERTAETVLPQKLDIEKKKCASVCEIDQNNKGAKGNRYQLNADSMTAALIEGQRAAGGLYVPERVKRNGKVYTVDTIASGAINNMGKVVLPDTIKKLEEVSITCTEAIHFGSGLEEIDEKAFSGGTIMDISISEDNPYFVCEEDALMDRDKTILYAHSNYGPAEYTIPASVKKIMHNAFTGYMIHQINIPDMKKVEVPESWGHRSVYINNMAASESDNEPMPSEEPTASPSAVPIMSPSVTPTESPTQTPSATVPPITPTPTRAPIILPTQKPSEEPTASPSTVPTASPSAAPTTSPTPSPTRAPIILPTQKPSEEPIASPRPEPTASPTTAPTAVPTTSPTPSPTRAPIILPTQKPSEEPIASPRPEPTASPTVVPTAVPTTSPTPSPTRAPIILPTQKPSEEPTASPGPEPTASPATATPAVPKHGQQPQTSIVFSENERKESIKLTITGLCLSYNEKSVSITWNRCRNAEFYRIYRAERKGKYRLIQVLTGMKTGYVDKKVNPAKRYYYKISAVGIEDGELREGAARSKSITIPGLERPTIKVKKGKADLVRYISVILKKYQGTHAQVYLSLTGAKFTKLKMSSGKIAKFRGRFRFQCKLENKVLWLKVRTYKMGKNGKTYSEFSKAAKIRV